MTLIEGQLLQGRYQIEQLVARGGYGAVYKAFDTTLKRHCAVKENLLLGEQAERQFEQEAQLLARLNHPNLPRVFDHFLLPGYGQYLVMDYIEGRNLHELLRRRLRPFSQEEALPIILQICGALAYLHSQAPPVVHRDVKPQNIIVTPAGPAMLVDFGVSKVVYSGANTVASARGMTPGYAAPEQYGDEPTDARCDVYSTGATLYTMLTGQRPVAAPQRTTKGAALPAIRQYNGSVSPSVEGAINRAMELALDRRLPSITQLQQTLAAARDKGATRRSPRAALQDSPWLVALVVGAAALLLLGLGLLRGLGGSAAPAPGALAAATVAPVVADAPAAAPVPTVRSTPEPTSSPTAAPSPSATLPPTLPPTALPAVAPTATLAVVDTPPPAAPPPAATPFGGGGMIVFDAGPEGSREIYQVAADGSRLLDLTNNPADDWTGSLSPPDGRWLLYSSNRDGNWEIYAQDIERGLATRLTNDAATDLDPTWSPDGTRILFHSDRSDGVWRLYTMAVNGDDVRVLTHDERGSWAGEWSPDGTRIVFSANYPGPADIYVMNADGSNIANLTNTEAHESTAHWSPDGRRIAFYSERDGNREIYMMDADGANVRRLTDDPATDTTPGWSPDGQHIVFASDRRSALALYLLNLATGSVTPLASSPAGASSPAWDLY